MVGKEVTWEQEAEVVPVLLQRGGMETGSNGGHAGRTVSAVPQPAVLCPVLAW